MCSSDLGIGRDANVVAGFPQTTIFRGAGGIHPAAPAVWIGLIKLMLDDAEHGPEAEGEKDKAGEFIDARHPT